MSDEGYRLTSGYLGETRSVIYVGLEMSEMFLHQTTERSQEALRGNTKISFGSFSGEIFKSIVRMKAFCILKTKAILEIKKRKELGAGKGSLPGAVS